MGGFHRDYEIAHEKSPRTVRGTSLTADGTVSITSSQLYPTEPFRQSQTTPLIELLQDIDVYLEKVIELVANNRDKTNLKLETHAAVEQVVARKRERVSHHDSSGDA